ncbi:MAG: hypothetical protein RO009_04090 [Pseudorhodoplanes sp.]|jgi:hypothetical protein|nr:hypothetical protein [Pseudorhodoplanes sp.]
MAKARSKTNEASAHTIIVIGTDSEGKHHAGRFYGAQRDLVLKAVQALGLQAFEAETSKLDPTIAKLPLGRLYSNGRGFVPFIRRDRAVKIAELMGVKLEAEATSQHSPAPDITKQSLPRDWPSITDGDLVIACDSDPDAGWWPAIVAGMDGDMLTLKWCQFPKEQPALRHRSAVALLYSGNRD